MRALILLALLVPACSQLNSLQIEAGENAMACVKGSTSATSGLFGGNIAGITVEVPSTVDTSSWTAEDWKTLAELCD